MSITYNKPAIPKGYNFLVILAGCFYHDANIQKISDVLE